MTTMQSQSPSPPVFILCCARSGSTLLRYVLDAHPDLACPPEMHLGRLCEDLRWSISLALGYEVSAPGPIRMEIEQVTPPQVLEKCRSAIEAIMADYLQRVGKQRWCDKSVVNIDHLPLLHAAFPDAKFVCLYRNCMDVVHSGLEVSRLGFSAYGFSSHVAKRLDNTVGALVDYWCDNGEKIHAFEQANPASAYRLRYEDLVLDPVATLPPLLEFLGLREDPGLADRVFKVPHQHGPGDTNIAYARKIDSGSIGKGSTISARQLSARDMDRANALLGDLGYALIDKNWDSQPSPYLRPGASSPTAAAPDATIMPPAIALQKLGDMVNRCDTHARIRFVFDELGDEPWSMTVSPDAVSVQNDDAAPVEAEVRMTLPTLRAIVEGEANPVKLLRSGELRISGDLDLVRRIFQA